MADGDENLADRMAVLRLRPSDSRRRNSPVGVASLRHAPAISAAVRPATGPSSASCGRDPLLQELP